MDQQVVIVVTAAVTGVVWLSSVWLGSHLVRENEHRTWRRDRCLQVYSEILAAVQQVNLESIAAYFGPDCGTQEHADQYKIVMNKIAEMHRVFRSGFLLAPETVKARMVSLVQHMTEVGKELNKCPKIEESDNAAITRKSGELIADFVKAARNDLHFPERSR